MSVLQVQTLQGPTSGANSNTVLIPSTNKLHAAGHVVQCVLTTSTTETNSTSTGWVANTLLDTSFTPKFSNSLIIVEVNLQIQVASANNGQFTGGAVRIKSGSTVIGGGVSGNILELFYYRTQSASSAANLYTMYHKTVEDDSSNTGARTYSFDTQMYNTTVSFGVSKSSPSTMKITEIAQ